MSRDNRKKICNWAGVRHEPDWAQSGRGGFTLIEVLVVIAIVAILAALLIPALGHARALGAQARELAAAQQTMVAFVVRANEHDGEVLPGFVPIDWITSGKISVLNQGGEPIGAIEAQRYPWRLAPYMDYNFRGLYQDDAALADLLAKSQDDFEYWVSLFPSLGMNTTFVGGDANRLGFNNEALGAFGRFYITQMHECMRPTRLIAFASARWYSEAEGLMRQGFFRVESPYFAAEEWDEQYEADTTDPGGNSGFVALRHLGRAVTAQMDGHAQTLGWRELRDMRRWADQAGEKEWVLGE